MARLPVLVVLEGDVAEWILALARSLGMGPGDVVAMILSHFYGLVRPVSRCPGPAGETRLVYIVEPEGPRVRIGEPSGCEELVAGVCVADRIVEKAVRRFRRDVYVGKRLAGATAILVTRESAARDRLVARRVYRNGEVHFPGMKGGTALVAYGEKAVYVVPLEEEQAGGRKEPRGRQGAEGAPE